MAAQITGTDLRRLVKACRKQLETIKESIDISDAFAENVINSNQLNRNENEMIRAIEENREMRQRLEMLKNDISETMDSAIELANRMGIDLENVNWWERIKDFYYQFQNFFFQNHPPPNNGRTPFGIPEFMMLTLILFFYFYL